MGWEIFVVAACTSVCCLGFSLMAKRGFLGCLLVVVVYRGFLPTTTIEKLVLCGKIKLQFK
jgi:hypothetical protein